MKEQNNKSKQPRTQDEDDGTNRSHGEGTPIYLTSDSTLQAPEEHAHDKSVDVNENTKMDVSDSDLNDINAGKLTGRDDTDTDQP